jgi:hypothetical protein
MATLNDQLRSRVNPGSSSLRDVIVGQELTPMQQLDERAALADQSLRDNLQSLGNQIFDGISRSAQGMGWLAEQADTAFGGDGTNAVSRGLKEVSQNVARVAAASREGFDESGAFQKYVAPIGQQLPNIAVGALSGPLGIASSVFGDAAAEAAVAKQQMIDQGIDPDIANYNSHYANLGNLGYNALQTALGANPIANMGDTVEGISGQLIRSAKGALGEAGQETFQGSMNAGAISDQPLNPLQYAKNVYQDFTQNGMKNFTEEGLPAAVSSAIMGLAFPGAGGNVQQTQQPTNEQQSATTPEVPAPPTQGMSAFDRAATQATPERNWEATERDKLVQQAIAEMERMVDNTNAEYGENGELLNPMLPEDVERFRELNRGVQQRNAGTLSAVLGQAASEPQVDMRPEDMVVGLNAFLGNGKEKAKATEAARMHYDEGKNSFETQKKTGWYVGVDGQLRKEVMDRPDLINLPEGARKGMTFKLSDVYQYPEFFKMYPEAANLNIVMSDSGKEGWAGVYRKGMGFELDTETALNDLDEVRKTILHELQHGVQEREGFAPGSNPDYMATKTGKMFANSKAMRNGHNLMFDNEPGTPEYERGRQLVEDEIKRFDDQSPHSRYEMTAGEWEARETERRAGWTAAERKARPIAPNPFTWIMPQQGRLSFRSENLIDENVQPAYEDQGNFGTLGDILGRGNDFQSRNMVVGDEALKNYPDAHVVDQYEGPDTRQRYEVMDRPEMFNLPDDAQPGNEYKLTDIYRNEELYKMYPELRDIGKVRIIPSGGPKGRAVKGGIIEMTADKLESAETFFHELQHLIQFRERFSVGGSPIGMGSMPTEAAYNRRIMEAAKVFARGISEPGFKKTAEYKAARKVIESERERFANEDMKERYLNNQGEAEARETANRRNWNERDRKMYPRENRDDTWMIDGGRKAFSVEDDFDKDFVNATEAGEEYYGYEGQDTVPTADSEETGTAERTGDPVQGSGVQGHNVRSVPTNGERKISSIKDVRQDTVENYREDVKVWAEAQNEANDYTPFDETGGKKGDKNGVKVYKEAHNKFKKAGYSDAEAHVFASVLRSASKYFDNISGDQLRGWVRSQRLGVKSENKIDDGRPLGQLTWDKVKSTFNVRIDKAMRNPGTMLHEISHYITEMARIIAQYSPDNAQAQKDWEMLAAYAGVDLSKAKDRYAQLDTAQSEILGNGLLEYFNTGKAPAQIKTVFERVKTWIKNAAAVALGNKNWRRDLTPEMEEFFTRVLTSDETFEQEYSADNIADNTGNVARGDYNFADKAAEDLIAKQHAETDKVIAEAPKTEAAKPVEKRGEYFITSETKGNITTVTKTKDTSNVLGPIKKWIYSPNRIAKAFAKFGVVFDMGLHARRRQDAMRADFQHRIDKVLGKKGILKDKADKEMAFDAMAVGDMMGKELTTAELQEMGASENAIRGYKALRHIYKNIADKIDAHNATQGKAPITRIEGYVPHFFGQFRVMEDGKILDSFPSLREAQKFAKGLDPSRELTIAPVINDFSGTAKKDAVTVGDMQYFKILKQTQEVFALNAEDAKEFLSDVVRMKNKHRQLGNLKQRKGFTGYNQDTEYQIRHMANLASRFIAMDEFKTKAMKYYERAFGKFDNDARGVQRYTKDYINDVLGVPSEAEEIVDKFLQDTRFVKLLPMHVQDRPSLAFFQGLKGANATIKLGFFNVASAVMNLTSMIGVAAKTGYGNTSKATAEYLASVANPSIELRRLYRGIGLGTDITAESSSSYSSLKRYRTALNKIGSGLFSYFDDASRKIAAISAYRQALNEKGMTREEAYEYAREVVDQTNYNYGVEDAPGMFRRAGPLGDAMMQFRKYGIKTMELGFDHLKGWEKVKFWGPIIAIAGIPGAIPGLEFISWLVKGLFPEEDIALEVKNFVAGMSIPDSIKRSILYGALSNIGVDVSSRAGFNDLIPTPGSGLVGPAFGLIGDVAGALGSSLGDGEFIEEFRKLVPGLSNPMTALEGRTKDKRGKTRFEYQGLGEVLLRATGFRPIREAVESDAVRAANYNKGEQSREEIGAIDNYLDNPSPETRAELKRLRIDPSRVTRAAGARRGSKLEQAQRQAATSRDRNKRNTLRNFTNMLQ